MGLSPSAAAARQRLLPSLSIAGRVAELPHLAAAIHSLLTEEGVAQDTIDRAQLAIEELVANVIKWGRGDGRQRQIRIGAAVEPSRVCITVEDDGPEFDPLSVPPADVSLPPEQRPEGGLGIHLVRALVDELTYRRIEERNKVEFRIAFKQAQSLSRESPLPPGEG